jgi:hypothetical protein
LQPQHITRTQAGKLNIKIAGGSVTVHLKDQVARAQPSPFCLTTTGGLPKLWAKVKPGSAS